MVSRRSSVGIMRLVGLLPVYLVVAKRVLTSSLIHPQAKLERSYTDDRLAAMMPYKFHFTTPCRLLQWGWCILYS